MATSNAIFEEHCIYSEALQNALIDKLQIFWTDSSGRFQINPVRNGRGIIYEVYALDDPLYNTTIFRSKKKAMQYVVAELFTNEFDYEHYGFTRHSRLSI
jgi:hypothetical protein